MSTSRLVAYLCVAVWLGGLGQGASNLVLDGRPIAFVPIAISACVTATLVVFIRRDRRNGTLK